MKFIKFFFVLTTLVLGYSLSYAQDIAWQKMEEAQKMGPESQKKILIYAKAQWCGYCKKMESKVFPRKAVQDSLHKYFMPVKVDIESDEKLTFSGKTYSQKRFARMFRVVSTPTFIFLDSESKVLGTQPGYLPPKVFSALISYVGMELFRKDVPFKNYLDQNGIEIDS